MSTIADALAEFVCGLELEAVPKEVVRKAKTCVLHNLGVGTGGFEAGQIAARLVHAYSARTEGRATVMIHGIKTDPMSAAFANSVMVHARGQEDVHYAANTHLGPTVMTAVIALAEHLGVSGAHFLTALISGYETSIAIGKYGAAKSTPRGFRASSVYGVIGAAAGCSKLLQLDREATVSALALSASFASGINQTWLAGTSEWRYQVAHAAKDGILAAMLALEGAIGARDAFEGPAGFFSCFAGERPASSDIGLQLGQSWGITEVALKPFPCCAANQSAVDAAIRLRNENNVNVDDISAVNVIVSPFSYAYPGVNFRGPFTSKSAAGMSMQFCIAVAIRSGHIRASCLTDFNNTEYLELVEKIKLTSHDGICRQMTDCVVEFRMADGRSLRADTMADKTPFNYSFAEDMALLKSIVPDLAIEEDQLVSLGRAIDGLDQGLCIDSVMIETVARSQNSASACQN